MVFAQSVGNLRDHVSNNPPAVAFFLCLLTLAISFFSLGSYNNTHILPNPDTAKDWNHLLSTLSQFNLCVNANSDETVSPGPSLMTKEGNDGTSPSLDSGIQIPSVTTLHLKVPVDVTRGHGLPNDVALFTAMTASQLRLGGNEIVTLEIHPENDTCTCLIIKAPAELLPMRLLPPECPASGSNLSSVHVEAINQPPAASQSCYGLLSRNDPALTVMLTKEEQWVAVRHLMEVSVCLIGVCLLLCLAASLTHSPILRNGLELQNADTRSLC